MKKCVFAGTFDPLTNGHINIIEKCLQNFDFVFVVVGENPNKTPLLPYQTRLDAVRACLSSPKVQVVDYLAIKNDYSKFLENNGVNFYVRGIRNKTDLSYEEEYKKQNKKIYPFIETVYFYPDKEYNEISSSMVKEKIKLEQDYSFYIPKPAYAIMQEYLNKK